MRAGSLRHKVTLQKPVETQNAYGEPEQRWQTVSSNIWASISPLRGREYLTAQQMTSEIDAKICLRHRTDVTAKMKIVKGTDEYLIEAIINPDERNRELELMCRRQMA